MVEQAGQEFGAKIAAELLRIEEDCDYSGKAHFNAAGRWDAYHYWLGVPAVVLSTAASAAVFKHYELVAGSLSAVVAILAALQTFLKPSDRAAAHKSAGDQYLSLKNDGRVFREIRLAHACDDQSAIAGLDEFTKRRNGSCPDGWCNSERRGHRDLGLAGIGQAAMSGRLTIGVSPRVAMVSRLK